MTRLPVMSGQEILKLLSKHGFQIAGRKGSHIRLKKKEKNKTFIVIVPDHKEIPPETLKSILRQAGISEDIIRK
ncbi:MAG: type II toxin-antitoxin system HicA family toxin [Candidatus Aenigmatarchaeota archaeon]